jgi:hypothetical protein
MALDDNDLSAWLQSKGFERTELYVRRGRFLAKEPTEDLQKAWVPTFKVWAKDPGNPEMKALLEDIEAELQLRGIEPSYDAVRKQLAELTETLRQAYDDLLKDPERLREVGRDMLTEFRGFLASVEQAKKGAN